MKKIQLFSLFLILSMSLSACAVMSTDTNESPSQDSSNTPSRTSEESVRPQVDFTQKVIFENVSDQEDASGEAYVDRIERTTRVYASFNVEDPVDDYFYEGWVICSGEVFTTGALTKERGQYVNVFSSNTLPEECDRYVLTIEPNDGNPAPADHVLDGEVALLAEGEASFNFYDEVFDNL